MLQIQHLTKVYGRNSRPAIEDVTFYVNNGEVVGGTSGLLWVSRSYWDQNFSIRASSPA